MNDGLSVASVSFNFLQTDGSLRDLVSQADDQSSSAGDPPQGWLLHREWIAMQGAYVHFSWTADHRTVRKLSCSAE